MGGCSSGSRCFLHWVKCSRGRGYQTAFIGKWHLDHPDDVNTWASGHGFDYAAQEQWPARFNPIRPFPPNRLWVNGDQEYIPYDYKKILM